MQNNVQMNVSDNIQDCEAELNSAPLYSIQQ